MKEPNTPQHPGEEILRHIDEHYLFYPHSGEIWSHLRQRTIGTRSNGCPVHDGYMRIRIGKKTLKFSHVAFYLFYRRWPRQQIDHADGDKSNHKPDNLREASNAENQYFRNMRLHWQNVSRETLEAV